MHVLHKVSPSVCSNSHKTLNLSETSSLPTRRGWWMSVVVSWRALEFSQRLVSRWTCVLKSHVKIEVAPCFPSSSGFPSLAEIREYFIRDTSLLSDHSETSRSFLSRLEDFPSLWNQLNFFPHDSYRWERVFAFTADVVAAYVLLIIYTTNNELRRESSSFLRMNATDVHPRWEC